MAEPAHPPGVTNPRRVRRGGPAGARCQPERDRKLWKNQINPIAYRLRVAFCISSPRNQRRAPEEMIPGPSSLRRQRAWPPCRRRPRTYDDKHAAQPIAADSQRLTRTTDSTTLRLARLKSLSFQDIGRFLGRRARRDAAPIPAMSSSSTTSIGPESVGIAGHPGHDQRGIAGRVVARINITASGNLRGVGHRWRGIQCDVHRKRNRRIAGSRVQSVAARARRRRRRTNPARSAGVVAFRPVGSVSVTVTEPLVGAAAGVAHGQGVGCAGLSLGEVARVALGDGQVGASGDRGWIGCRVVRWIDLAATENDGGVGHRRRSIGRDRSP